jgi:hypothetical protein
MIKKKLKYPLIVGLENSISFHPDDPDVLLFELLLSEHEIGFSKSEYGLFTKYVCFRFFGKDMQYAEKTYKKLKSVRGKSFRKPNYWPLFFLLTILVIGTILTVIFQLYF